MPIHRRKVSPDPADHARGSWKSRRWRPLLQVLEDRCLLAAAVWPGWLTAEPAQSGIATLDSAHELGLATEPGSDDPMRAAGIEGTIGDQRAAGEVDWYSFTLETASTIQLTTFNMARGRRLASTVSLFNAEPQDFSFPLEYTAPPFNPQEHRLLAQVSAGPNGSSPTLERRLAPGTYYVAVSGQGNEYFNPFLAESGFAGRTGDYRLLLTASPLPLSPADGPVVLNVDPQLSDPEAGISGLRFSPLAIWVGFSGSIDPGSVSLLQNGDDPADTLPTVQLIYNPSGGFGDGNDRPVLLSGFHYAAEVMELQLKPAAPLAAGFYQLTLAGDPGPDFAPVLTDDTGSLNLGQNVDHPAGQNFIVTFRISGTEGAGGATLAGNDTPATARDLGELGRERFLQVIGVIGDDPAYDPAWVPAEGEEESPPYLSNPAADVDLYHFRVSGPGGFAFTAEVFAGRFGSTLDASLSLFRFTENAENPLQLIASNDSAGNQIVSSHGRSQPLYTDPLLEVGLSAGDYYLAVSSAGNMPGLHHNLPGTDGVFDPLRSHSGLNGFTTGGYVLNVSLQPAGAAPRVHASSPAAGAILATAPVQLTVTFDSHVNVVALANRSFEASSQSTVSGVFIVGPDGQQYFPRLKSYDAASHQATFLMLDRLPNGAHELRLSGAHGLAGRGGIPLAGNDPSGDHVISFTVADPEAPPNPQLRLEAESNDDPAAPQALGVLFPHELQHGVTAAGALTPSEEAVAPDVDFYRIELIASQEYHFALSAPSDSMEGPDASPGSVQLILTDGAGNIIPTLPGMDEGLLLASLSPGLYTVQIRWSEPGAWVEVPYEFRITLLNVGENPPPLSVGATPVLSIRSFGTLSLTPVSDSPSPPVTVPTIALPRRSILDDSETDRLAAFSLRAALAGGASSDIPGRAAAVPAPHLVQGLDRRSTFAAREHPLLAGFFPTLILVGPRGFSDPGLQTGFEMRDDSLWASWREWLSTWTRWLESVADDAPDWISGVLSTPAGAATPVEEEAQTIALFAETGAPFDASDLLAANWTTKDELVPASGARDLNDELAATPDSSGAYDQDCNEGSPASVPWFAVASGAALASLHVWGRIRLPASDRESHQPRRG